MKAFEDFKEKNGLDLEVGDLTKPFDPELVRMKLDAKEEQEKQAGRQVLIVPV